MYIYELDYIINTSVDFNCYKKVLISPYELYSNDIKEILYKSLKYNENLASLFIAPITVDKPILI